MPYEKGFKDFKDYLQRYRTSWPDMKMWIVSFSRFLLSLGRTLTSACGDAHRRYNQTEWAITKESHSSTDDITSCLKETTEWFDEQDWVIRYAWFVTGSLVDDPYVDDNCALLDTDGALTELGKLYYA